MVRSHGTSRDGKARRHLAAKGNSCLASFLPDVNPIDTIVTLRVS